MTCSRASGFTPPLFATEPTVRKDDYAKWQLDDPRVNFAISTRGKSAGLDHLGIQAENGDELEEIGVRLAQADVALHAAKGCLVLLREKRQVLDARPAGHCLGIIPHPRVGSGLRREHGGERK